MMALGTIIGGSFFLGSSIAINAAGPGVLIAYVIGGALVYCILFALSEMTVANPGSGSFRVFAAEAFGKGAGFVVGWVYWTGMVLAMSSEATAVAILLREWLPNLQLATVGGLIIIGVTLLNLLGADKLSKLEGYLAGIKISALVLFSVLAVVIIVGILTNGDQLPAAQQSAATTTLGGLEGIAGSMLIIMFSYAGFEIIGLAACEAKQPRRTVPRAIRNTVFGIVGLYVVSIGVLLPLLPAAGIEEDISPFVLALKIQGIEWATTAMNIVLITAILSTMLAAMFGIGRMMRSLADEGHAPGFLRDRKEVPYRGIIASGVAMLIGLGVGMFLPRVYLFLISSGGFAMLFIYAVIMATHIRFRKKNGCPPDGKCQLWGFPYTSAIVLVVLILSIASMPLVPGQEAGLIAGGVLVAFYSAVYLVGWATRKRKGPPLVKSTGKLETEQSAGKCKQCGR